MGWIAGPSVPGSVISMPIHGGPEAPGVARRAVLSRLDGRVTDETARDVALVVSELVTNSVLHAKVGEDDSVLVELAVVDDRLAIAVTDPGSKFVPRLVPPDPTKPRGFGLQLVDGIATCWGVRRSPGATQVWFELDLGEP